VLLAELATYHAIAPLNVSAPPSSQARSPLADQVPPGTRVSTLWRPEDAEQFEAGRFEEEGATRAFDPAGRAFYLEERADWVGQNAQADGVSDVRGYGEPEPYRVAELLATPTPPQVWQLLNVGLFVRRAAPPFPGLAPVPSPRDTVVLYRSPWSPGRVRLVPDGPRVLTAPESEAWQRVRQPGFDPAADLVLDRQSPPAGQPGPPEGPPGAEVVEDRTDLVRVQTRSPVPATLVLADAAYPGWLVEVDGVPAESLEADGALRAVHLSTGEHGVTWRYRPASFRWGAWLGALALLTWLALLGWALWSRRRSPVELPAADVVQHRD
jgi:hypothetical protein